MKKLSLFVYSILAGISISIGAIAFLCIENKVAGAVFFSLGLFIIVTRGYALYTGRAGAIFENKPSYLLDLLVIWIGNFAGCLIAAALINGTRNVAVAQRATELCTIKLNDTPLSIFFLSIYCNILVYFAVDNYKRNPHEIGKYFGVIFGIAGFIVCGFEHCVANMFYFSVSNMWSVKTIVYLIIMTAGNTVGAVFLPLAVKLGDYLKK